MRRVQVYVEGQRLELFNDEQITVKSEQQNIADISSVRTDFSQTFTIPASVNNNKIFKHFYESAVDSNTDHNIRRKAVIEIDLITFKKGFIQLEKSQIKNGQPDNYALTFYGEVIALKDKFGDELLSDISELSNESYQYNPANVLAEIQDDTVSRIKFPLVVNRDVTYGDGSSTDISHTGTGAIHTDELFPAINFLTLFNAIQLRYDLTFSGTFFSNDRFKRAYLYCKNANDFQFYTQYKPIEWSGETNEYFGTTDNHLIYGYKSGSELFNLTSTETLTSIKHVVGIKVNTNTNTTDKYFIEAYNNGSLMTVLEGVGTHSIAQNILEHNMLSGGLDRDLTFKVRGRGAMSMSIDVVHTIIGKGVDTSDNSAVVKIALHSITDSVTLGANMDVISYLPKMKVADFFKGVLNMFNLTCYSVGADKFQLEPLSDWYSKGAIVDISEHTIIDSIGVDRVPLYKNISLEYKKSKSANNEAFSSLFKKEYGDAKNTFNYEGGDYKIKLPFENLMMHTFRGDGSDLQVGKTVDSTNAKYIPEPMVLYMSESVDADFNMNDGSHQALTSYVPFGQDMNSNGVDYSLNFSADNSTLLGYPIQQNLFATYYYDYLSNLYNLKNRNVTLKAVFPVSLLTSLELNDRLIIRDKRYIINSMTTNVTNGEVSLDLIQDFRATLSETGVPPVDIIKPDNSAQCLDIRVLLPKNCVSASISGSANFTSITPTTITEDSTITVCIPENTVELGRILTEDILFNLAVEDGSGDDIIQEEVTAVAGEEAYILTIIYTFSDGSTASSTQVIIQEP